MLIMFPFMSLLGMAQGDDSGCGYQLSLEDSYGDGWNGGTISLWLNGEVLFDGITLDDGTGPEVHDFNAETGDAIKVQFTEGDYSTEIKWELLNESGDVIASQGFEDTSFPEVNITALCPMPQDLGFLGWVTPVSNNNLGNEETITLILKNSGSEAFDGDIDVAVNINGTETTETLTAVQLAVGEETTVTLTSKFDFSEKILFNCSATLSFADDGFAGNNTCEALVYNGHAGDVYLINSAENDLIKVQFPMLEGTESIVDLSASQRNFKAVCQAIDGKIYAISSDGTFTCIDKDAGTHTDLGDLESVVSYPKDMVYLPSERKMLILAGNGTDSKLYALDMVNHTAKEYMELGKNIIAMELKADETLLMVNKTDKNISSFNLSSKEYTVVAELEDEHFDNYYQQLVTDNVNDKIYYYYNKASSEASKILFIDGATVASLGEVKEEHVVKSLISPSTIEETPLFLGFGAENQKLPAEFDYAAKHIDLELLFGSDLTAFVPEFIATKDTEVKFGETTVVSGETELETGESFTLNLVKGDVTEEWTIDLTVGENHKAEILSFSIPEQLTEMKFDETINRITGKVGVDVDLTKLVPSFTLSENATMFYQGATQVPGTTEIDFTSSVKYTVYAEDGGKETWTVELTALDVPGPVGIPEKYIDGEDLPTVLKIDWYNVETATSYKVFIGEDISTVDPIVVEQSEVAIDDLEANTAYQLKIVAVNEFGESTENQLANFTTGVKSIKMDNATVTVSDAYFYDDGVLENYSGNASYVLTMLPAEEGKSVKLFFEDFFTESNTDKVYIYNGDSDAAPGLEGNPFTAYDLDKVEVIANNDKGALTIGFTSDLSLEKSGWKARVSLHEWLPKDVNVEAIELPAPTSGLTATESVTYVVSNVGTEAIEELQAIFTLNGEVVDADPTPVTLETPIAPGSTKSLTQELDMSEVGVYNVELEVVLSGDTNTENNTISASTKHTDAVSVPSVLSFEDENDNPLAYYVESNSQCEYELSNEKASLGEGSLMIHGTNYSGWASPWAGNHWEINENHKSLVVFNVKASEANNLMFSFDLNMKKFSYYMNNYARVTVNGTQIGDNIIPESSYNSVFRHFEHNLSAYNGQDLEIIIETRSKDNSDEIFIDNVKFWEQAAKDIIVKKVSNILLVGHYSDNESAKFLLQNNGSEDLAGVTLEAIIDGDESNKVSQAFTFDAPLAPGLTKEVLLPGIDLTALGSHTVVYKAVLEGDADLTNNELEVEFFSKPSINTFPYVQDFEGDEEMYWTSGGLNNSWELATPAGENIIGAASGTKAWITNADGAYNGEEFSFVETPAFDFSGISSPVLEVKTWWNFAAYKYAYVLYSADNGATWGVLGEEGKGENWYNYRNTYNDECYWKGDGNGEWLNSKYMEMPELVGKENVLFRFVFQNDYMSIGGDGFAIDDFKISERPAVEAAIVSVEEPSDLNNVGEITPKVVVANYGGQALTTTVRLNIQPGDINFEKEVTDLAMDATVEVEFDAWTAVSGEYTLTFSIDGEGDANPENNEMAVEMELNKAEFITFRLNYDSEGTIDEENSTIWLEAPKDADMTALKPVFYLSSHASATVDGSTMYSGISILDFTNPVVYTVAAADGSTKDWTVTIDPFKEKGNEFVSFAVTDQIANTYIDFVNYRVYAELPYGTDLSNVAPEFTLSANAVATVDGAVQESGVSSQDFSAGAIEYTVVSEFGEEIVWSVELGVQPNAACDLVAMSAVDATATAPVINAEDNTVTLEVEYHADLTNIVLNFEVSEMASLYNGDEKVVDGVTAIDFTSPVVLNVVAENGLNKHEWTVTVAKEAPATNADLAALKLDGTSVEGFAADQLTYQVELPSGTTTAPAITTELADEHATVVVTPAANILSDEAAERTASVVVTAEDATTEKTYTIEFRVISDDANLSALKVDGVMIEGFDPETLTYEYKITDENVTATPEVTVELSSDLAEVEIVAATNISSANEADRTTTITVTAEDATEKVYTVVFEKTVGLGEISGLTTARVYPNPSNGVVNIDQIDADYVQVFNAEGEQIKQLTPSSNVVKVNLVNHPAGVYTLRMIKGNQVHSMKLILK